MPTTTAGTEVTVHVIGRCPAKGCHQRKRNTFPGVIREDRWTVWTHWTIPTASGPANAHAAFAPARLAYLDLRSPWDVDWAEAMMGLGWFCWDHDHFMTVTPIKGTVNISKPCTPRCAAAYGPSCECVCGGERHGARWA